MYKFEQGECAFYTDMLSSHLVGMSMEEANSKLSGAPLFTGEGSVVTQVNHGTTSYPLPCYPEEVSESVSATWSTQSVIGRVGALQAYSNTSDVTCSFSFDMHMEVFWALYGLEIDNAIQVFEQVMQLLKSTAYPQYQSGLLIPPRTKFVFGDFKISGRVDNISISWKLPIIDKKYAVATVQVQMTSAASKIIGVSDILADRSTVRGFPF